MFVSCPDHKVYSPWSEETLQIAFSRFGEIKTLTMDAAKKLVMVCVRVF